MSQRNEMGLVALAEQYIMTLRSYERSLRSSPVDRARALDEWVHSMRQAITLVMKDLASDSAHVLLLARMLESAPGWLEYQLDNTLWLSLLEAALDSPALNDDVPLKLSLSVQRSVALMRAGQASEAEAILRELTTTSRPPSAERLELAAWNALGQVEARRGRYPDSKKCHEHAQAIARRMGDLWLALEARMNVAVALDEMRESERAIAEYEEILSEAQGDAFVDLRLRGLQNLGTALRLRGSYAAARAAHETQLGLAREFMVPRAEAEALNGLGLLDLSMSNYVSSLNVLKLAKRLRETVGDVHGASVTAASEAIVLDKLERSDESQRLLEAALEYATRNQEPRAMGMLRNNLFNRAFAGGPEFRARQLAEENAAWAYSSGDPVAMGMAAFARHRLLRRDGNDADANAALADAVAHFRAGHHHEGLFSSLFKLAQSELANQRVSAYDKFFDCLELADAAGHTRKIVDCLLKVALCEYIWVSHEAGDLRLQQAEQYNRDIDDAAHRAEVARQVAELRADFAADRPAV